MISTRSDVQMKDLEKWQNTLLPSHQLVFTVLTTSADMTDHEEARRKRTREKTSGYFFQGYNKNIQIKASMYKKF